MLLLWRQIPGGRFEIFVSILSEGQEQEVESKGLCQCQMSIIPAWRKSVNQAWKLASSFLPLRPEKEKKGMGFFIKLDFTSFLSLPGKFSALQGKSTCLRGDLTQCETFSNKMSFSSLSTYNSLLTTGKAKSKGHSVTKAFELGQMWSLMCFPAILVCAHVVMLF